MPDIVNLCNIAFGILQNNLHYWDPWAGRSCRLLPRKRIPKLVYTSMSLLYPINPSLTLNPKPGPLSKSQAPKRLVSNRDLDVNKEVNETLLAARTGKGGLPVHMHPYAVSILISPSYPTSSCAGPGPMQATATTVPTAAKSCAPNLRRLRGKSALSTASESSCGRGSGSSVATSPSKFTAGSAKSTPMRSPELKKVKVKAEAPATPKSLAVKFSMVLCLHFDGICLVAAPSSCIA